MTEYSSFEIVNRTDADPSPVKPWVHPLDAAETGIILESFLSPELTRAVRMAKRPSLSLHAPGKEREEAVAIQQRRQKARGEDDGAWVARTMYEETFGVLPVFTVGGLISHTNEKFKIDGREVSPSILTGRLESIGVDIPSMDTQTIATALVNATQQGTMDEPDAVKLIRDIVSFGSFTNNNAGIPERLPYRGGQDAAAVVSYAMSTSYSELLEAATAIIKAYKVLPGLTSSVTDTHLIQEFPHIQGMQSDQALRRLWFELSGADNPVFKPDGSFKGSADEGFPNSLRKLAITRSSPDFGFLYDRFSIEGSLASNQ